MTVARATRRRTSSTSPDVVVVVVVATAVEGGVGDNEVDFYITASAHPGATTRLDRRVRRIYITGQSPAFSTPFRLTPGGASRLHPRAESFATTKRHAPEISDRNGVKVLKQDNTRVTLGLILLRDLIIEQGY